MESPRYLLQRLRGSLFVTPTLVVGVCIAAAVVARYLDREVAAVADLPVLLSASLTGGRSVVTAVAGATITVAAIVFSITALSSQIAASQYSPRAVAGFFDDRFQQVVIGLVVGTFAYCLIVLAGLAGVADSDDTVRRSVSITLAVVLGVVSGVAIVAYIDHSLRRMRVATVVRRIAESTLRAVRREYRARPEGETLDGRPEHEGHPVRVRSHRMGWVRAIDARGLVRALDPGALARVEVRVGEFVAPGDLLATVWLEGEAGEAGRALGGLVHRAVHTGRARSVGGDPAFGIRQLVDIALRALSPGINDPSTAVDVIQHLKVPLREILVGDPPMRIHHGRDRRRVFLPEAPSRSDLVHQAFSEIRLSGSAQPSVLEAVVEVVADLVAELEQQDLGGRCGPLRDEARLAVAAARGSGLPEADVKRVLAAAERLGLPGPGEDAGQGTAEG